MDSELTAHGYRDAGLLGNRLSSVEFNAVYASPSRRTIQTAEAIVSKRPWNIVRHDDLREIRMGEWEGRTHAEVKQDYPEQYHAFWNTPHLYKPAGGGETFPELQRRVVSAINQIVSETDRGNVLVVSHIVAIKATIAYVKKVPLERFWEPPAIHGASLSVIEISDGCANVVCEGDISHLTPKL